MTVMLLCLQVACDVCKHCQVVAILTCTKYVVDVMLADHFLYTMYQTLFINLSYSPAHTALRLAIETWTSNCIDNRPEWKHSASGFSRLKPIGFNLLDPMLLQRLRGRYHQRTDDDDEDDVFSCSNTMVKCSWWQMITTHYCKATRCDISGQ